CQRLTGAAVHADQGCVGSTAGETLDHRVPLVAGAKLPGLDQLAKVGTRFLLTPRLHGENRSTQPADPGGWAVRITLHQIVESLPRCPVVARLHGGLGTQEETERRPLVVREHVRDLRPGLLCPVELSKPNLGPPQREGDLRRRQIVTVFREELTVTAGRQRVILLAVGGPARPQPRAALHRRRGATLE